MQKLIGDDKVEDIGCLTALSAVWWRGTSGEVHNSESIWMHGNRSCHRCQIPLITVAGILTTFTTVHKIKQNISDTTHPALITISYRNTQTLNFCLTSPLLVAHTGQSLLSDTIRQWRLSFFDHLCHANTSRLHSGSSQRLSQSVLRVTGYGS